MAEQLQNVRFFREKSVKSLDERTKKCIMIGE